MADRRPEVVAQTKFRIHRDTLAGMDLRQRFDYILRRNLWSSEESRSGSGSTLAETATLRNALPRLLGELGAATLLDIPCGDFGWLSTTELGVEYTGADIVASLVEANQRRYGSAGRAFVCLDLTSDKLPVADVVLCRDCLVHLSYANIDRALKNIRASGAKWLLMTHFLRIEENYDIEDGDWRPLNFELPPFGMPAPRRVIVENCSEAAGAYDDKALCLWATVASPCKQE
jgi:hypothetical protein